MMDPLSVATTVFDLAGRLRRLGGTLGDALDVSAGGASGVSGNLTFDDPTTHQNSFWRF